MILTPAYGRDYKSKRAVLDDFNADNDFVLNDINSRWDGCYVNRPQIVSGIEPPVRSITFRYDKLRKSFIHKLT